MTINGGVQHINVRCQCTSSSGCFSSDKCHNSMTQEDMLCDDCRALLAEEAQDPDKPPHCHTCEMKGGRLYFDS